MKKSTKTILVAAAVAAAALILCWLGLKWSSACGRADADLVVVNQSYTPIGSVGLDFTNSTEVGQRADSSPLKRGESLDFEVGSYPVTVTVYGGAYARNKLASCVIGEAPPEGEHWCVFARDGESGVVLEVGTRQQMEGRTK